MTLQNVKALILDMDGVLWRGSDIIGDLSKIFDTLKSKNIEFLFATNNSTKTIEHYINKFTLAGVEIQPWQVISSAVATIEFLVSNFPQHKSIFVIGEDGLINSFKQKGFEIASDRVDAVVIGLDTQVNYEKLSKATHYIRSGAAFFGTNPDTTLPTPQGLAPGAGSIISSIEAATGVEATIIGKPKPIMFQIALDLLKASADETLVVGDRLETDILGAQNAGCQTALVLSGVSTREMAASWKPPPTYIFPDLESLVAKL